MLMRVRKTIAQLATGGGKTVTFAGICKRYLDRANKPGTIPGAGKTVLIIVHRIELLTQTRKTCFNAFGITCQPVIAGMKHIPPADVYVCMVETLSRILNRDGGINKFGDVGIVIIDEAHRLEFMKIHDHFPTQYIIGFTATPITASRKKPLKNYYDDIVCGVDIPHLISNGDLCQNITYAPKNTVDRIKLAQQRGGIMGGDFNDKIMGNEFSKIKYVHNTVESYKKHAEGTKALIFNVNVIHSKIVTDAFTLAGYPSKHIDGTMGESERTAILKWFETTPGAILNNVGIGTTGLDIPTIETVIVNKATMSLSLWLQMCGRGSRPTESKLMFTIIDMGGNAITHGDWNQSRDWDDMFHHPDKPGKNNVAPVKTCPQCDGIVPASTKICILTKLNGDVCGWEFNRNEIPVEHELHEFVVVTKGIDVNMVIQMNAEKKEFAGFYSIGERLAADAKKTIDEMNDEFALFILDKYHDLGREWLRAIRKKSDKPNPKRRAYNQWYQNKAREILVQKLKFYYPKWETKLIEPTPQIDLTVGDDILHQNSIKSIGKIDSIKMMHYER